MQLNEWKRYRKKHQKGNKNLKIFPKKNQIQAPFHGNFSKKSK